MAQGKTITVCKLTKQPVTKVTLNKLKRAIRLVLEGEGQVNLPVSVVLCDDATIHKLNFSYLGHDYPTDVLSFPLSDPKSPAKGFEFGEPEGQMLGEIVISVETAERNAKRYRQTLERELLRLAIHGTLHLLGYEDDTPSRRQLMRRKERFYLKRLVNL